ncbi:MAG: hypothetical protein WKG06_02645 [Segetibacter sp.]
MASLLRLPKVLGHKVFNLAHMKTIKNLADDRNAFIHYKWNIETEDIHEADKEKET